MEFEKVECVRVLLAWLCSSLLDRDRNHWECALDDPKRPIRWTCAHRHGGMLDAVRCALHNGPRSIVLRVGFDTLATYSDAQTFTALMRGRRAHGQDVDGDQALERWLNQRVKAFAESPGASVVEWLDGSSVELVGD